MAGDGLEHARPPLLPAHSRAVADAAVPYECGTGVRGGWYRVDGDGDGDCTVVSSSSVVIYWMDGRTKERNEEGVIS